MTRLRHAMIGENFHLVNAERKVAVLFIYPQGKNLFFIQRSRIQSWNIVSTLAVDL